MGVKIVQDSSLSAVADAIRAKTGKSDSMEFPTEFVSEIGGISGGGGSGDQNVKLLHTLTFVDSNDQQDITPDTSWDGYDYLLFVPDLTVSYQEGETDGNWLWFSFTANRGTASQYDSLATVGQRGKSFATIFLKGWASDRYYWRFTHVYSGRGGSVQLKTVSDYDSENISDLTFKYGAYRQGTNALLNGTVNIYGVKLPL